MSFFSRFFGEKEEQLDIDAARLLFGKLKSEREKASSAEEARLQYEFNDALSQLRASLEDLRTAKLLNKNIPQREIAIMEGNRSAYINQVGLFLTGLGSSVPGAALVFGEQLNKFLKSSFKPYQVLTYFCEAEASKVAKGIKKLEQVIGQARKMAEDSSLVEDAGKAFASFDRVNFIVKELSARKKMLQKELREIEGRLDEISGLKEGPSSKLERLRSKLEKSARTKEDAERKLHQTLSQFSKLFRKYYNLKGDKLSHDMSEHPVETACSNPEAVAALLHELSGFLLSGNIGEKEQERRKLMGRLAAVDKAALELIVNDLKKAESEFSIHKQEMENSGEALQLKGLVQEEGGLGMRKKATLNEISGLKVSADADALRQEIGNRLSNLSGRKITICSPIH